MPIGRGRRGRGNKLEPTDNSKQSDTNKLPDESDTDHNAFSDCSSEDGSLNKQSLNDPDSSVDSGHDSGRDSDCLSKSSTLSDVTSSEFSSLNDSTSDSNDTEHPLTSLSSNDSNYVSGISDIPSSYSSPKSGSVARKGAEYLRTYDKEKTKSSFNTDTYKDKVQHELLDHEVQRYSDKMESAERHTIPCVPHNFIKEGLISMERKKREIVTYIAKHLLHNTDYTDDSDYTDAIKQMSLIAEKLDRLKQYPVKYSVKEAVDELLKLAATGNAADSIAALKGCLGYLKDELAAGRLTDDHLANYLVKLPELVLLTIKSTTLEKEINNSVYGKEDMKDDSRLAPVELDVVSDVNGYQNSDDQNLEYLCDSMGKAEKDYSTLKKIKDCKYFQNRVYRQEDVVVMFSSDGNGDPGDQADNQVNQADNQGNQGDNQGNGTNIPADIPGQAAQGNPQAVELPENIVDTSTQQQGQEYSPMLAVREEGARGAQEKVFEVPKPFELPEKSELVTLFSHPFHTAYHVEDQPVTSEFQRFSKILASKGVTIEMIVGLVHTSATCVEYHISKLLHSVSVIIDDAEQVFFAENICKCLPAVVKQALIMMNQRPIPVTESEADIPFATSVTPNSHVPNRPHDESLRHFPPEALRTSSRDQSMAPVDGVNNFQVTTNPLQDTDSGVGDVIDIRMYEMHHSAEACNVIEVEDFQLRDYCCCICGTSTCQGERIIEEIRTLLLRNARCCICIEEITNLVNFNTRQNCIPGMLRTHVPQETMQRNVALGCLEFVTRCQMFDASHIFKPVAQCSINSFINLQCRNLFSNVYGHLSNTTAMITSEGPISFVNVQNLIDRLCSEFNSLLSNQSILQLLTQQATSEYLSSCHEHIQRFLFNLPHGILQNASSKLSISLTVMPDGVPIDMDQLRNGLLSSRVAPRFRDSITSSLHLPPINAFNNIPIIVNWTIMIQSSPSCLQVGLDGVEYIDPVEAVNLHGRESLVTALQPTYSHYGDEESTNPVQPINNLVENPIFDPNDDGHKTNRADIYDYFPEGNSLYEQQPSDNDTIVNDNQINCEPEEATDDS